MGIAAVLWVTTMYALSVSDADIFQRRGHMPTSSLVKTSVTDGVRLTFTPFSIDTQWSDISILLSDGTNTVQWATVTTDLDDGTTTRYLFNVVTLGALNVYCNVTDLTGNGYINQGDYFTLTTGGGSFSSSTLYWCTIMHDPAAYEICHQSFYG